MSKYNDIRALADLHAQEISRSPRDWTDYLDTAAQLYRYDFLDSLLIHAQRPQATACAELEVWNAKMGRWVNKGAKGIALIDDTGPRKRLRYVFDIQDTHLIPGGRTPWLWKIEEEQQQRITDHLIDTYALDTFPSLSLVLQELSKQLTEENLEDAMDGLSYEIRDTFLEGLGDDAVRVRFRTLMENSTFYVLAKRCGLEPMVMLESEDFADITDFNNISVLSFLGNAVHDIAEPVLKDIGKEIAGILRENTRENMQKTLANGKQEVYNQFSALKHESETNKGVDQNDTDNGTDVSEEGRLSVPESGDREQPGDIREVRDAPEVFPEGEQEELVSEHDAVREAGEALAGDRPERQREDGADHDTDGRSRGSDGEAESLRSDDLGSEDEQYQEPGGGDRADGIGLQLTEETTEQDMTEAEEEIASALSLPELPTVNEQRRMIEARMEALYAGELTIPSEVVDEILRTGSNQNRSQLRIIYDRMIDQPAEDYTSFIKREYGKGGKGFVINGTEYSVWFDELGMQIAAGHTAQNQMVGKVFLTWDDVSGRIQQLLNQGEYAPQVVLDAARDNALREHAEALAFMERDMAEGVSEIVFDNPDLFAGGFPEETERLAEYLSHPENVSDLVERLEGLAEAYSEDKSVMRFQFYNPDRMLAQFQKFSRPAIPFAAREDFAWQEHPIFITDDEVDAYLSQGGPYSESRLATYSFFLLHPENADRAAFLKDHYGVGGSSPALSGAYNSNADYGPKGIVLNRGSFTKSDATVKLTWSKAAKRVGELIEADRFLTAVDVAKMPAYERQQMANKVIGFYDRLPDSVERPFTRDFFHEESRKEIVAMLEEPERAAALVEKMDAAFAALPLEYEDYDRKLGLLSDLHGYVDGVYTIFPEKEPEPDLLTQNNGQISMLDFFAQEQEPQIDETALEDEEIEAVDEELPPERMEQITEAFEAAELTYDNINSYGGHLVFLEEGGTQYSFESWQEAVDWIEGVIFDDPSRNAAAERVLHPERIFGSIPKELLDPNSERFFITTISIPAEGDRLAIYDNQAKDYYVDDDQLTHWFESDSEILDYYEDVVRRTNEEISNVFEYNGYSFVPLGTLEDGSDLQSLSKNLVSNNELGMSRYDTAKQSYSRDAFYEASNNSSADVFQCVETGKLYVPGENELFEYTGFYIPLEQEEERFPEAAEPQRTQEEAPTEPEQALHPLSAEMADEYNTLKEQYPDALIGFEQFGHYEFYGEDARRVAEILGTRILDKEIPGGTVAVTGFPSGQWVANFKKLWGKGNDVYLAGETEDGHHQETKYLLGTDYLPIDATVHIEGREFRIDTVNFKTGEVSMQDMTMMRQSRYPLFRNEPIEYVRSFYEEEEPDFAEIAEEVLGNLDEQLEPETIAIQEADIPYALRHMVSDVMAEKNTSVEDYSPEQLDVIYAAADSGHDIKPMCNPEFSPEQMQLIVDFQDRIDAQARAIFQGAYEFITSKKLSISTINDLRKTNFMPLEDENGLTEPTVPTEASETKAAEPAHEPINFHITDDDLGAGGPKAKFRANMTAIYTLQKLETWNRQATPEEQEILSRYVGWGGIPQAFDPNNEEWRDEYAELKENLTSEEYREARASTLNAFYTSPTVIKAMYEALGNMGLTGGNVLEPSCGVGNFMGLVPETMDLRMYGVELDSISGRIARQLYQKNQIAVQGFETTEFPDSFFDCVIGNVPFGQYKVSDKRYDRFNFLIHDYFIARSLDLTRPGGVVAVVTSSGTMDKQNESVRQYLANRADLIGAIRLPDNAFMRNANTGVVADILFFQKRDRAALQEPEWVHLGTTPEGYSINQYFVRHPEMVLGEFSTENTQYGKQEVTVKPIEGANLADQLKEAISHIHGSISKVELSDSDLDEDIDTSIPADPNVKNFSFTNVDGRVYYRENSRMNLMELPAVTTERVLGMIAIRDTVQELLDAQMENASDAEIALIQRELNEKYDTFTAQYGILSNSANKRAFQQDSSYCLLASLEVLDEELNFERKADIFTKRTIRRAEPVTSVDTASEALALSIGEKAGVDLPYMAELTGKTEDEIVEELQGVIFKDPLTDHYETSDAYLSGNVREKLRTARQFAENHPEFQINVEYLEKVQPRDLDASEIEVRLGAPWVKTEYIERFMEEVFHTPWYLIGRDIQVKYAEINGQWNVSGKNRDYGNALTFSTYGTERANAYRLLEDILNLRDTKIYDTFEDADGKHRVLNKKETMLAQQKQEMIREAFKEWVFRDMDRREDICRTYNELFNSTRPREYDGSHIRFVGMTPEITLMQHQKNAVAHILYGDNTLLAHCVGAGKTFQMIAAGMESKRLGLAQKCLYVVPNHLTEQWGSDFLRLYPGANILVATKKDFEPANRKKFCSRIATGDYDAVIIGHSQFEKIPLSRERQITSIERQIDDLEIAIQMAAEEEGSRYTIKQMEKTRKSLEAKLAKLNDQSRKDDVVTFEQLGVDRLFVDESHFYKNLFLYTKMRNVAGIAQTDAQKSSDMFMKCQYMDELTGGKGITFATGTPVSNSMVELYTIMRYLQYDTLQKLGLGHFDSWAASFGETVTAIELSPEGTGYRAKTRFARFFNLPELISLFKESADVQTADMLNLPVPEAEYINEVLQPTEEQKALVVSFGERAEKVRGGGLDPKIDNMLTITNDGRKCALDQRLINDMLPDAPESKVNRCVENAFQVWQDTMADKGAQLIFCDLSTPKADGTFNVYDDLREKLVAKGIPREEIVFIHEATTENQKVELFAKVRAGQVRILVGSTPKLGAGTNVQDRLAALHHLDCPWKPSDLEQQEGRILRQGNKFPKVKIFRYVTEGTFDAYMWVRHEVA